ncbi:ER membrane glycoprotein subunit of the GPI transamidase complex-like protein [Rhizina undulata]
MKQASTTSKSLLQNPYRSLLLIFCSWKFILLVFALFTPSPGYDTSTTLILPATGEREQSIGEAWPKLSAIWLFRRLCEKLTRWDAIYFIKVAERGYINEQEWAFGWGYSKAVSAFEKVLLWCLPMSSRPDPPYSQIISAILVSNISHLLSVLVLFKLTLVAKNHIQAKQYAFLVSCLHILSPAGLFLSAPYSESLFSFLAFTGNLLYVLAERKQRLGEAFGANLWILASAIIFSLACTVRSNGILNGLIFLHDFAMEFWYIFKSKGDRLGRRVMRIFVLGIGGILIALGLAIPQIIAWKDFCGTSSERPWCLWFIPTVYTWNQNHYWNVGLFRYWTVSNIPLFVLAAPMLVILIISGVWGVNERRFLKSEKLGKNASNLGLSDSGLCRKLALSQILLAAFALVSYHVQIITRLSSGYFIWYWWLGRQILDDSKEQSPNYKGNRVMEDSSRDWKKWIVRWMVVYGIVQGVLFAGFLPPA